jgi:hypothetical protein
VKENGSMSFARTRIKGLVYCDSRNTFRGLTLFTPIQGKRVLLIDILGKSVSHWDLPYDPAGAASLLPNGHLLYGGKTEDAALPDLECSGGIVQELGHGGEIVREYRDPTLHHAPCSMRNGNTLVLKWIQVPESSASQVKGGASGTERDGVMWGDMVQEVQPDGRVVWEWVAHEHMAPGEFQRCPLCPRDTWMHANGCVELPDGNIMVSFAKINTVAIIEKKTGKIIWHWGTGGELAHQHSPSLLDNGNILIYDNGYHPRGLALNYSRIVEVDMRKKEMVWSYEGPEGGALKMLFYSSMHSNCQRLPNGNTLVCEGMTGRIFEVTAYQTLVWEYVNAYPGPPYPSTPDESRSYPVYGAFRYGSDYPGLSGLTL